VSLPDGTLTRSALRLLASRLHPHAASLPPRALVDAAAGLGSTLRAAPGMAAPREDAVRRLREGLAQAAARRAPRLAPRVLAAIAPAVIPAGCAVTEPSSALTSFSALLAGFLTSAPGVAGQASAYRRGLRATIVAAGEGGGRAAAARVIRGAGPGDDEEAEENGGWAVDEEAAYTEVCGVLRAAARGRPVPPALSEGLEGCVRDDAWGLPAISAASVLGSGAGTVAASSQATPPRPRASRVAFNVLAKTALAVARAGARPTPASLALAESLAVRCARRFRVPGPVPSRPVRCDGFETLSVAASALAALGGPFVAAGLNAVGEEVQARLATASETADSAAAAAGGRGLGPHATAVAAACGLRVAVALLTVDARAHGANDGDEVDESVGMQRRRRLAGRLVGISESLLDGAGAPAGGSGAGGGAGGPGGEDDDAPSPTWQSMLLDREPVKGDGTPAGSGAGSLPASAGGDLLLARAALGHGGRRPSAAWAAAEAGARAAAQAAPGDDEAAALAALRAALGRGEPGGDTPLPGPIADALGVAGSTRWEAEPSWSPVLGRWMQGVRLPGSAAASLVLVVPRASTAVRGGAGGTAPAEPVPEVWLQAEALERSAGVPPVVLTAELLARAARDPSAWADCLRPAVSRRGGASPRRGRAR